MGAFGKRLQTVVEFVLAGLEEDEAPGLIADIGYDHGLLLVALAHKTVNDERALVGVETEAAFSERFRERHPQVPARLLTGDGISVLTPHFSGPIHTIVCAGIGEDRIRAIFRRAPEVLATARQLVVAPANRFTGRLRPWLFAQGWRSVEDQLVRERGRDYVVSRLVPGAEPCTDPVGCQIGPSLDPLQPAVAAYIDQLRERRLLSQRGTS